MKPKRRSPPLTATTVQGRPMANLGLKRLNKKLRHQIKQSLKRGSFELKGWAGRAGKEVPQGRQ